MTPHPWAGLFGTRPRGWKAAAVLAIIFLTQTICFYHFGYYRTACLTASMFGANVQRLFDVTEELP